MRNKQVTDFLFQLFALLISVIVVHGAYVTVIRPTANAIIEQQRTQQQETGRYVAQNSIAIILKDYEQELEIILGLWVLAIIGQKARNALRERRVFEAALLDVQPGTSILPEDVRGYVRPLQALPDEERESLLPRVLLTALTRFQITRNIQDTAQAVRETCEMEADRLDSELSMVRYVIWAIPSIGFIGTVRGIGAALAEAPRAVEGDILGVTVNLGTAFNSTLVALLISMVIMFLVHQLQLLQERLVLDTQNYCDVHLLRHLQVRQEA